MEIQYLNKLEEYLKQNNILERSGIPLSEIEKLETLNNITFPKAYKEYLTLTGKYFRPISSTGLSSMFEFVNDKTKMAKANLKEFGLEKLISKDFWVVSEMDGLVFIHYIFLDEGDNPPIYTLDMEGYTEFPDMRDEFYGKMTNSFSDYVEAYIESYDPKYD